MQQQLTTSLILRNRKSRFSQCRDPTYQSPRRTSFSSPGILRQSCQSNHTILSHSGSELEFEKSDYADEETQVVSVKDPKQNKSVVKYARITEDWFGQEEKNQKTLNDMVFNLQSSVQKKLYYFNFLVNIVIRILFINLLVFLSMKQKWVYREIFLSLWVVALLIYIIIMIKMLFTRSDKESVYFQKIFNEKEWADIESQRLMRTHFNFTRIVSKIKVFFNPMTKFQRNIKISFLRQDLFKRIQLVMVYFPFSVIFFLNQNDFVTDDRPNFNIYIAGGICIEVLRTAFTYLVIYIYS